MTRKRCGSFTPLKVGLADVHTLLDIRTNHVAFCVPEGRERLFNINYLQMPPRAEASAPSATKEAQAIAKEGQMLDR